MKIDRSLLPVIANAEDDDVFCFTFFSHRDRQIGAGAVARVRACVCDEIVEV